jgi:hypothetical protein
MRLDEEERVLIELARDTHDPSDEDRARVRSALAARLGAVAGLGAAAGLGTAASLGSSAKAAAAAGAGGGFGAGAAGGAVAAGTLAAKLIGAAVVVAAAVGVPTVAVHRARHARIAAVTASARSSASRDVTAASAPVTSSPEESPPASTQSDETARPSAARETGAPTPERGGVPTTGAAAEPRFQLVRPSDSSTGGGAMIARPSEGAGRHALPTEPPPMPQLRTLPTVADEARMVHDGVVALRAGDAEGALALFDRHAAIFPRGALAEERDAERALALAELGRTAEAQAAAEEFLRAHPTSPLSARLRERLLELDVRRNGSPAGPANSRPTK